MHDHEFLHGLAAAALLVAGAYFVPASWLAWRRALAPAGPPSIAPARRTGDLVPLVVVPLIGVAAIALLIVIAGLTGTAPHHPGGH